MVGITCALEQQDSSVKLNRGSQRVNKENGKKFPLYLVVVGLPEAAFSCW